MLPLLRGAGEIREEVFAEGTYHAAYEPQRAIRTRRWKYIRRFDDRRTPVVVNTDDGPAKNAWLAAGWAERAVPPEELYDLVLDPAEGENLIDRDEHAAVARDLRARLLRWMAETGDPLLDGPVRPASRRRVQRAGSDLPARADQDLPGHRPGGGVGARRSLSRRRSTTARQSMRPNSQSAIASAARPRASDHGPTQSRRRSAISSAVALAKATPRP